MGAFNNKLSAGANPAGYTDLGNGLALQAGHGVFVTSGTSVVIRCPFKKIYSVQLTPVFTGTGTAAAAANGQLTASGLTVNSDGTKTPTTDGQFKVYRVAGTDSALAFDILIIGEARH